MSSTMPSSSVTAAESVCILTEYATRNPSSRRTVLQLQANPTADNTALSPSIAVELTITVIRSLSVKVRSGSVQGVQYARRGALAARQTTVSANGRRTSHVSVTISKQVNKRIT